MLLPWQTALFKKVTHSYWRQQTGHALLLIGENGSGLPTFLKALQTFFLCKTPNVDGACGHCQGCRWFEQKSHPDLYEREEDIGIDEVRGIHTFLQTSSHQGNFKIISLQDIDTLSMNAANALLKNLEEPPNHTLFLLTANSRAAVLPTILSRCLCVTLHSPTPAESLDWLKKECSDQSEDTLYQALTITNFQPISAAELLKQEGVKAVEDYILLKQTLFWQISSATKREEVLEKIVDHTKETLYLFYYWLAELCAYSLTRKTESISSSEEHRHMTQCLEYLTTEELLQFFPVLTQAIESSDVPGINKSLLWGSLLSEWSRLIQK